jgi:hypothetical protein
MMQDRGDLAKTIGPSRSGSILPRVVAQRLLAYLPRMLHGTLADCVSHRRDYGRNATDNIA